jgi:hypothetical protein
MHQQDTYMGCEQQADMGPRTAVATYQRDVRRRREPIGVGRPDKPPPDSRRRSTPAATPADAEDVQEVSRYVAAQLQQLAVLDKGIGE